MLGYFLSCKAMINAMGTSSVARQWWMQWLKSLPVRNILAEKRYGTHIAAVNQKYVGQKKV